MPQPLDLSGVVNTTKRVREYVWETEHVSRLTSVDAIIEAYKAPENCIVFSFQDECVVMYAGRATGVSAMSVKSPETAGVPSDESYFPEDAIRALLSYLGVTIGSFGAVLPHGEASRHLRPLTSLAPSSLWDAAPHFKDVEKLFELARNTYKRLPWSE